MNGADAGRDWRTVLPFLVGIACFVVLAAFNQSRHFELWRNYALSGVILGAPVVYALYRTDVRVPHYIQWVIVAALLLHYGGGSVGSPDPYHMGLLGTHGINGAYHTYEWWDNLTHGMGILAGTMGAAYLVEVHQTRRGLGWRASAVAVVAVLCGLAAGVGVELYEYLGKTAFQTIDQGGYVNTARDLQFNLLGALVGGVLAATINRARFHERIQAQWRVTEEVPRDAPAWRRLQPGMVGLVAFVAVPALASLYLSAEFYWRTVPADDSGLYDIVLGQLTLSAAIAAIAGPLAAVSYATWLRRRERGGREADAAPAPPAAGRSGP